MCAGEGGYWTGDRDVHGACGPWGCGGWGLCVLLANNGGNGQYGARVYVYCSVLASLGSLWWGLVGCWMLPTRDSDGGRVCILWLGGIGGCRTMALTGGTLWGPLRVFFGRRESRLRSSVSRRYAQNRTRSCRARGDRKGGPFGARRRPVNGGERRSGVWGAWAGRTDGREYILFLYGVSQSGPLRLYG